MGLLHHHKGGDHDSGESENSTTDIPLPLSTKSSDINPTKDPTAPTTVSQHTKSAKITSQVTTESTTEEGSSGTTSRTSIFDSRGPQSVTSTSDPTPTTTVKENDNGSNGSGLAKLTNVVKGTKLTGLISSESTTAPTSLITSTTPAGLDPTSKSATTSAGCSPAPPYPYPGSTATAMSHASNCATQMTIDHQTAKIHAMTGTIVALSLVIVLGPLIAWEFWKKLKRPRTQGQSEAMLNGSRKADIARPRPAFFRNSTFDRTQQNGRSKELRAQDRISTLVEMEMSEIYPRRRPPPPPPPPTAPQADPLPHGMPVSSPQADLATNARASSAANAIAKYIRGGGRPASSVYSRRTNS
ncbi:Hypothetical predicted protein [Lecanosticta acicola]|uniref:Uncharacterized protein n=1 Tax=Lecanosticta acicola TaxID=111012 RepID=A0AAI8Z8A8_9PEZI|nr:Hypothetical predicted protein [Lecanosticta acicola]